MLGYTLSKHLGLINSVIAIILGNIILFCAGLITSKLGFELKVPTVSVVSKIFGDKKLGLVLFAVIMSTLMSGWGILQLKYMSSTLCIFLKQPAGIFQALTTVVLGALVILTLLGGLRGVGKLALLITPLLIGTLLISLFRINMSEIIFPELFSVLTGVPLVVSLALALVIDQPTYAKTLETRSETIKLLGTVLLVGLVLIECAGALLACSSEDNLISCLMTGGMVWQAAITVLLISSGFLAAMNNIYSASISLERACQKIPFKFITTFVGIIVTLIALLSPGEFFKEILELIGTLTSSVGALMICWYFTGMSTVPLVISVGALVSGCAIGILHLFGVLALTPSPVLDSFLTSGVVYLIYFLPKFFAQSKIVTLSLDTPVVAKEATAGTLDERSRK
jgi:purine-cytosine permease-like protein